MLRAACHMEAPEGGGRRKEKVGVVRIGSRTDEAKGRGGEEGRGWFKIAVHPEQLKLWNVKQMIVCARECGTTWSASHLVRPHWVCTIATCAPGNCQPLLPMFSGPHLHFFLPLLCPSKRILIQLPFLV
ncbi:uncharacterized protein AAES06_013898 isoform 1-T1 [Glossophaga mutica]